MAIIRRGWVLRPPTVIELQPLTSQLSPVAISYPCTWVTTHARGGTLDLLMTDVSDLVRVAVVAPIGNSDQSSLSAVISMAQAVPNLCVSRNKSIGILSMVQYENCLGVTFYFLSILLRF